MRDFMGKKRMASEFSTEENYFDRLPTELIISIFDKILDVKCLCICYSVSRLFSALVPQTRFVAVNSVQIPSEIIIHDPSDEIPAWPPGIINFLKELRCVESVTIRLSYPDPEPIKRHHRYGPLLRWRSDSTSFILVSADDRIDDNTDNLTVETTRKVISSEYYYALLISIREHLFLLRLRVVYIKELLVVLPNLKNVSVVESTERGSVVWEEDIDSMKKIKSLEDHGGLCVKLWSAPLAKLPSSGCAMKDAALIWIRETEGCHDLMEKILFREREYRELAMFMMNEDASYETTLPISFQPALYDHRNMAYKTTLRQPALYDLMSMTSHILTKFQDLRAGSNIYL